MNNPAWTLPRDGITYSLLCRFIVCRERFRLHTVEGLREERTFDHKMEFGSIFHAALEEGHDLDAANIGITNYTQKLIEKYPTERDEVIKWANIAKATFPGYSRMWRQADKKHKVELNEEVFDQSYTLPTGRVIRLRGKWDAVLKSKDRFILQENKTKGFIDEEGLQSSLHQNLQTMFYLIPLIERVKKPVDVLYNVIQRPQAGGKSTLYRRKDEPEANWLARLQQKIIDERHLFFHRWDITITRPDVQAFKDTVFDPIMMNLVEWWDSITNDPFNPWHTIDSAGGTIPNPHHFQTPFGVFNPLTFGFRGDFFKYLTSGSMASLSRTSNIFPELEVDDGDSEKTKKSRKQHDNKKSTTSPKGRKRKTTKKKGNKSHTKKRVTAT